MKQQEQEVESKQNIKAFAKGKFQFEDSENDESQDEYDSPPPPPPPQKKSKQQYVQEYDEESEPKPKKSHKKEKYQEPEQIQPPQNVRSQKQQLEEELREFNLSKKKSNDGRKKHRVEYDESSEQEQEQDSYIQHKGKQIKQESFIQKMPEKQQEQKIYKLQTVKKTTQVQPIFIQDEIADEDSDLDEGPTQIKCEISVNKLALQVCKLCQQRNIFQITSQNWDQVQINENLRQSFQPLIEFVFKSIGDVGDFYLGFKDHYVCLSAENLQKQINIDKVLKHFTGNQLDDYKSTLDIPQKSVPTNFILHAEYGIERLQLDSLLNGFSCRKFNIGIKSDLQLQLGQKNSLNVKQIVFQKYQLKIKYNGLININGLQHQACVEQSEGGKISNLIINSLELPREQKLIEAVSGNYLQQNVIKELLSGQDQMFADLSIQTHREGEDVGLSFNLRRKK